MATTEVRMFNVVLLARVDDLATQSTVETRSTIQPVHATGDRTPAQIAEMALELAAPVSEWSKY